MDLILVIHKLKKYNRAPLHYNFPFSQSKIDLSSETCQFRKKRTTSKYNSLKKTQSVVPTLPIWLPNMHYQNMPTLSRSWKRRQSWQHWRHSTCTRKSHPNITLGTNRQEWMFHDFLSKVQFSKVICIRSSGQFYHTHTWIPKASEWKCLVPNSEDDGMILIGGGKIAGGM